MNLKKEVSSDLQDSYSGIIFIIILLHSSSSTSWNSKTQSYVAHHSGSHKT